MEALLHQARRRFCEREHLVSLFSGEWVNLRDEEGNELVGIRGRMGAVGLTEGGIEFGADLLEMQPGSGFPLHTHPGDHLLYVIHGHGIVHVDGVDHPVKFGDTIFIPADYPHGVQTDPEERDERGSSALMILAVGIPHKHVAATDRMHVVTREEEAEWHAGS